jgi:hypothetical protein
MHRITLASCCLALFACTAAPTESSSEPIGAAAAPNPFPNGDCTLPEVGPVYGMMQTSEGLTLQLDPSSCRRPDDVSFVVEGGMLEAHVLGACETEGDPKQGSSLHFAWSQLPSFSDFDLYLAAAEVAKPGSTAAPSELPEGAAVEWLYGALVKHEGVELRVYSGGCTEPEDFEFYVEPGDVQQLIVVRREADHCKALVQDGKLLHFTWEQLGVTGKQVRINNPFRKLPA